MSFNHQHIEKKWQKTWEEEKTFKTSEEYDKRKFYALDMFPYPSGAGLHVGHPEGYTATDILSRLKRMQGYNVLHPMGWDAFGLPAEQYALDTGTTRQNLPRRILIPSAVKLNHLAFLMIGIVKSARRILNIINGHNGFSYSFLKKVLLMSMKCR